MLAEDDENDIIAINRTLERNDFCFELMVVETGEDCLDKLDSDEFDLILLDISLPGIDGMDVLEQMSHKDTDIPVIVITGHGNEEIAVKCMKLGAYDYLVKATDLAHLVILPKVIKNVLDKHDLKKEKLHLENLKADFIAMLTHDLKTPLTAILGYSELILKGDFGKIEGKMHSAVTKIQESSDKLYALVEDFLTTSKIDAGSITLELNPIAIPACIHDSVEVVRNLLNKNEITIKVKTGKKLSNVMADYFQLSRVFINLLSNAIKYSDPKTTITIDMHNSKEILNYIEIAISDMGKGISPEELPLIFDRYKRAKIITSTEGTGLGLFIVHSIIDMHRGKITVESEVDKGTTFKILLPALK